jgi:hypothetical protein
VNHAAGKLDADDDRPAFFVALKAAWHVEEVVFGIALLLPAVGVEVLSEIALLIEQPDSDERQAEVARRLQVIAREDAEAAGVDRKTLVEAELRGEIGDLRARWSGLSFAIVPGLTVQVVLKRIPDAIEMSDEAVVVGEFVEPILRFDAEQFDRIVIEGGKEVLVDAPEQENRVRIPAPPEVVGQFRKTSEFFRKAREDGETANFHRANRAPETGRRRQFAESVRLVYDAWGKDEGGRVVSGQ